jgi:hypothetical protein
VTTAAPARPLSPGALSLEQAPPIQVPFRFFLTAPLFLALAACLVLKEGGDIFLTRHAPATLALTHLVTLGVMAMVMCGSLLQVLPVVVGSPVPKATTLGALIHAGLTLGTLALTDGFLHSRPKALLAGGLLTSLALLLFLAGVFASLWRAPSRNPAVRALWVAAAGLLVTAGLGLFLVLGRSGALATPGSAIWANLHPGWGILGWTLALVTAVASQVVPMFMLTPQYPQSLLRWLPVATLGLLLGRSAVSFLPLFSRRLVLPLFDGGLVLGLAGFALTTFWLFENRKRKVADPTLPLWRASMASLVVGSVLWCAQPFVSDASAERLRLLATTVMLAGFALTIVFAMLFRIVPFLAWFHLQGLFAGSKQIPNMKQFVPDRRARVLAWGWLFSLSLIAAAAAQVSEAAPWAAGATLGCAVLLLWGMLLAVRLFRQVARAKAVS